MRDPDPRVSGRGFAELRAQASTSTTGVCEAEARRLNQAFITVKTRGRPLVVLKAATSLDAQSCRAAGRAHATHVAAKPNRKTQQLRAAVDAIAVGSETVLVDDPLLTARECHRVRPLVRVVFDRRLRTPPTARVFSTLVGRAGHNSDSADGAAGARAACAALEAGGRRRCASVGDPRSDALRALLRMGRFDAARRGRADAAGGVLARHGSSIDCT